MSGSVQSLTSYNPLVNYVLTKIISISKLRVSLLPNLMILALIIKKLLFWGNLVQRQGNVEYHYTAYKLWTSGQNQFTSIPV